MSQITTLFFDIGGVCLSNGWDHEQRQRIAKQFNFDYPTFDARHRQVSDTLERGQLSLQDYLQWTLFYEARDFTAAEITEAIKNLSTPIEETLELLRNLKGTNRYRLMTINNESRELNEYRIQRFRLTEIFSAFFSSCYLGLMKPQPEHYRRALDISQSSANSCVYIDDRPMNLEVARILGMKTILFKNTKGLKEELQGLGVEVLSP
jgi:putative hydrolase of the HAD superfamily